MIDKFVDHQHKIGLPLDVSCSYWPVVWCKGQQNWAKGTFLGDSEGQGHWWGCDLWPSGPLMMMHWFLLVRYELIHSTAVPVMLNCVFSLCSNMVWSMVSKAADGSSSTTETISCLSMVCRMSALTLNNVVSVLWLVLYADQLGSMML